MKDIDLALFQNKREKITRAKERAKDILSSYLIQSDFFQAIKRCPLIVR